MSRLPNPNDSLKFDRVSKDLNGNPEYGFRNEGTPDEEIVHIPTNRSNQTYYTPEKMLDPEGCPHEFQIIDAGRREIQCKFCTLVSNFHPGVNYLELEEGQVVNIVGELYSIK